MGQLLYRVVSSMVMGLWFYGVVTPVAMLVRLRRGWTARFYPDREQRTYWVARDHTSVSMRQQY